MARIPLADSSEQLTTQAPAGRQREGIFTSAIPQANAEFAQTVAKVAQRFEEAQTLAEKTKADTLATRKLKELEVEAQTSENIWDMQKFKARIGEIKEEASGLMTLPQARNEFGASFDRSALVSEFSIQNTLRTRQIDNTVAEINENLTAQRETYITGDPITQKAAETKRDLLLSDAVARGIIKAESAQKSKEASRQEWRLARIDADIESDPESALEQLKLGEKGIYADVDAGDRDSKKTVAASRIDGVKKQIEQLKTEKKVAGRFTYIGQIADGTLNWQNSAETIRSVAIKDPELAEAMQKVIDSEMDYFPEEGDNEAYADLVKNVFTAGTKEETSDFLLEALTASSNKEVSRDRLAILVNAAGQRAKNLPLNENDSPVTPDPKQTAIDAGVKSILNNKNKLFSAGDMIVNFFKGLGNGKSPTEAHSEAVNSEVNRTNPLSVKHKAGDIITNPNTGETAEIVGFNENGSPMLKRKLSGKQPSAIGK